MLRSLRRRLDALDPADSAESVLEALDLLRKTGKAPNTPAGIYAAEVWEEAQRRFDEDFLQVLWAQCQITGKGLAELMHSPIEQQ